MVCTRLIGLLDMFLEVSASKWSHFLTLYHQLKGCVLCCFAFRALICLFQPSVLYAQSTAAYNTIQVCLTLRNTRRKRSRKVKASLVFCAIVVIVFLALHETLQYPILHSRGGFNSCRSWSGVGSLVSVCFDTGFGHSLL